MNEQEPQKVKGIFDNLRIFNWGRELIASLKAGNLDGILESLKAIADLLGYGAWGEYAKQFVAAVKVLIVAIKDKSAEGIAGAVAALAEVVASIVRQVVAVTKTVVEGAVKVMASAPPTRDDLDRKLDELKQRKVGLDPITIITLISAFLSIFKNLPDFLAYIRERWNRPTEGPAVVVG